MRNLRTYFYLIYATHKILLNQNTQNNPLSHSNIHENDGVAIFNFDHNNSATKFVTFFVVLARDVII